MNNTPNLGLKLTPVEDNQKTFLAFRTELAGDGEDSNMMVLDAVVGSLQAHKKVVEDSTFTWGLLKTGYTKS